MISPGEFRDQLSRIIRVLVLFILLFIFWSAAPSVPGADAELFDGLVVSAALQIVIAAILIGLAASIIFPLGMVFARYGITLVGARPGSVRTKLVPAVSAISDHVAEAVVLVVVWRVLQAALPLLMTMNSLANADWLRNGVTLVFLGLLLLLIWNMYLAARPLFDELSFSLSERIAVASEKRCSVCGTANPNGVTFCGSCGARMDTAPASVPVSAAIFCPYCGTENPIDSHYCVTCGKVLVAGPSAQPEPKAPPIPARPTHLTCSTCGAANTLESRFCAACGQALGHDRVAPSPAQPHVDVAEPVLVAPNGGADDHPLLNPSPQPAGEDPPPVESSVLRCPNCGTVNPADSLFCGSCGRALSSSPAV